MRFQVGEAVFTWLAIVTALPLALGVPVSSSLPFPQTFSPQESSMVLNATNNAQPVVEHCTNIQRQQILHAWFYAALEMYNAGTALIRGDEDRIFLAMFKTDNNAIAVRELLRKTMTLRPLLYGPKISARISCSEHLPAVLERCVVGPHPEATTTVIFPDTAKVYLCPRFFQHPIAPNPKMCPAIIDNRFLLNRHGTAFNYGQAFDIISSLASLYAYSRPQPIEPPANAIRILNQVMGLPGDGDPTSWDRIACYFLCECSFFSPVYSKISKEARKRLKLRSGSKDE